MRVVDNGKFGVELSDVGPGTRIVDNVVGAGKKGKKAVAADDASEGIALATLEAMARELSAEAESETECESEVGEDKQEIGRAHV